MSYFGHTSESFILQFPEEQQDLVRDALKPKPEFPAVSCDCCNKEFPAGTEVLTTGHVGTAFVMDCCQGCVAKGKTPNDRPMKECQWREAEPMTEKRILGTLIFISIFPVSANFSGTDFYRAVEALEDKTFVEKWTDYEHKMAVALVECELVPADLFIKK